MKKWVYLFNEVDTAEKYVGGKWDDVKGLLGGKGANLAEMTRIGIPVPPGFTITTEACNRFLELNETFPDNMWSETLDALKYVEKVTGKRFGDKDNPLLVSCRSGAKFSMPGMMDTILNIGLNDETSIGMIKQTNHPGFVYDSYRRLIQMFSTVVIGIPDEEFEDIIRDKKFSGEEWKDVAAQFKKVFKKHTGYAFPEDPYSQLKMASEAVFKSWNGKRAVDYRNAANIPHDLGTAVNIVAMVFGNMGDDSATGVAMTRNGFTGEPKMEGDYLTNAQGEDVVAGIRLTKNLSDMKKEFPEVYEELKEIGKKLEKHYEEMQDIEFTIENNKLWMLQTRDAKRTAKAAVRIAVDMHEEGFITKKEAVMRITPEHIDFFLHPQFSHESIKNAITKGNLYAKGLNVSPGAALGMAVFDADTAEKTAKQGKKVIMVRLETKPDDVHGMLAAEGILTTRGGRTSHAALVARQFGKPAVVGAAQIDINMNKREMRVKGKIVKEGDMISINGATGEVFVGELETIIPDMNDKWLLKILSWADEIRKLGVWGNADYPTDAERARGYGAEGIGLCRTEHMFFQQERLKHVVKMIMSDSSNEKKEAINAILPFQRQDFIGIFKAMEGLPVIIRLIDPPLHEFLPDRIELEKEITELKTTLKFADNREKDNILTKINEKEPILQRIRNMAEANPMLGLRGVRLGIHIPELTIMQVRAIFEAACAVAKEGIKVYPEVMIPLTSHVNELKIQREVLEKEAKKVMDGEGIKINYKFGTMIEIPRAALTADKIAEYADFVSFGTNDLTQTTFGISRDDAESGFLMEYINKGILPKNPFATLDRDGVGLLMKTAVEKGRGVNPKLECGICGEHGGDPESIFFCHELGLTYVSCSPFRVPIARLSAAHAAIFHDSEAS